MRRLLILLVLCPVLLLACLAPSAAGQPAPSSPATGFLRVQGRTVRDGAGRPVRLRGVNMDTYYYAYGWNANAPWEYADQDDIAWLDGLGVNAIRLALHWRYFESSLGFDLIDAYLDWCRQAGIYVVLDMHITPPAEDLANPAIWTDPAVQQQFLDLWASIAARYATDPIVAGYDLYNEPSPPDEAQWWDLAERTVDAIRAVDANHILFVELPMNAGAQFRLVDDPNVVYSYHDYEPFVVTHAGAEWVGDSPIPDDYGYPGPALTGLEWADYAADAATFEGQAGSWVRLDSGVLTAPAGVEFATLKPAAFGNTGEVWFDDLALLHNGAPQTVYNPGAETASADDPEQPANWYFWTDSDLSGDWSRDAAHSGAASLKITGDGDGFAIWGQSNWIYTAPLFPVQAGDTFRVTGWVRAPQNQGSISLGLDYLNGIYESYDRARLLANVQPYLDWAAANAVPLYVGEFGAMGRAPGSSRANLVRDKIDIMNQAGVHWALWTYRDMGDQSFGLVHDAAVDTALAEVLRQGMSHPGLYLPMILRR
jgi:endoglucanase